LIYLIDSVARKSDSKRVAKGPDKFNFAMSFANGVLDSSPVALPKITPPKRTLPTLDDVATRVAKGKKRKADFDHASSSSSLHERGVNRGDGKRIKTAKRDGRENVGDEHPSQMPAINEKKSKAVAGRADVHEEAVVERFLKLSDSMGLDPARIQAPLTPPASYRTIQPKASGNRAVSEPASPSSTLTSPSSKSNCSTVADGLSQVDLDNPFAETPAGMTRSTLLQLRRQSIPDSPDEVDSETLRQNVLEKLKSGGFSPARPVEAEERRVEPPVEVDSQGEKSYLTYIFKGKRIYVPNELFKMQHDPREDLPVTDANYVPALGLKPRNLFPKATYGREARMNALSSSSAVPTVVADDPFIDRPIRKRT